MAAALDSWHDIIRNGDASTLDTLIADDAVFHSPVVHTPQVGKALVVKYLTAAANAYCWTGVLNIVTEMVDERQAMLEFQVTLDDIVINGVDHIRWNDNNQIIEFKVWVRPLKGMQKLHQAMAKLLNAARPENDRRRIFFLPDQRTDAVHYAATFPKTRWHNSTRRQSRPVGLHVSLFVDYSPALHNRMADSLVSVHVSLGPDKVA